MSVSKIEQLIEDIYDFIENCKTSTFSPTKVVVQKDELYDLLDELRLRTPDEIKRYQKIIVNRDNILADAQDKAEKMIVQAREHTTTLLEESEIVQQAYQKANELMTQATEEANYRIQQANSDAEQIRSGALSYTESLLTDAESIISNAYDSTKGKYDLLMKSLKGNLEIIENNKRELSGDTKKRTVQEQASDEMAAEIDFDFNEDTFLEDVE